VSIALKWMSEPFLAACEVVRRTVSFTPPANSFRMFRTDERLFHTASILPENERPGSDFCHASAKKLVKMAEAAHLWGPPVAAVRAARELNQ
jgi:hypothetical protein